MSHQIIIQAKQIGKNFHIYKKPIDRVKQFASMGRKKYYRDFWALKDINFTLKKGESLGIIGRNGSGKSTLLQILCQTMRPTTGSIEVNGRVAAMLELGAGFNPEFTGKENVYLNGAILGFSRKEMDARYDEIVEFADIGEFINQPVKSYSSGMFVRLAFAVQSHVNPDILVVDEALSVGDIFFQQKCAKRMNAMREQGCSLIFVSHDMGIVRDLCQNVIYLKSGQVVCSGSSVEVIQKYYMETHQPENVVNAVEIADKGAYPASSSAGSIGNLMDQVKQVACWLNPVDEEQEKKAILKAVAVMDKYNLPTTRIPMMEKLKFHILYQSFTQEPIHVALALRNRFNHTINISGSYTCRIEPLTLARGEYGLFELEIDCMLEAGDYTFCAYLGSVNELANRGTPLAETPWLGPITISFDYENQSAPWFGMFGLPVKGNFLDITSENTIC